MKYLTEHTSSIVFCAVAAALALLFVIMFVVASARKKRVRRGLDAVKLIFGSLVFIAAFVAGAFAVVNKYELFKLSVSSDGSALAFLYAGKKLFSVPALGIAVVFFNRLKWFGIAAPFALCFLSLIAMLAVSIKTYSKKKAKKQATKTLCVTPAESGEKSEPEKGEILEETAPKEQGDDEDTLYNEPAALAQETGEMEFSEPPDGIDSAEARNIVDEIDKLVTGEHEPLDDEIDDRLRRAIKEGYALSDAFENPATANEGTLNDGADDSEYIPAALFAEKEDVGQEEYDDEDEDFSDFTSGYDEENNGFATDGDFEREPCAEEELDEENAEPSYEDFAFANEPESEPEREEEIEEEDETPDNYAATTANTLARSFSQQADSGATRNMSASRKVEPVRGDYDESLIPTRVRTIIRRPTAKNIEEIERRVVSDSEREKELASAKQTPKTPAKPLETEKTAAVSEKKKPASTRKKSGATTKKSSAQPSKISAAKDEAKTAERSEPKNSAESKSVVAEINNLPLTRKYIILNRRNAAAVFNEYLNGKREQEKKEITGSLNTIIIK